MKAKGEAGMGAMVHEMEESFKKSPKLYGSILIVIALTIVFGIDPVCVGVIWRERRCNKRKR